MCSTGIVTGQLAFTIQATDPEGDPLTYTLSGADAIYFEVNQNTGQVDVRRSLDREVWFRGSGDPLVVKSLVLILCVFVFSISIN